MANPNMIKGGPSVNPGGRRKAKVFTDALMLTLSEDPRRARAIVNRVVRIAIDPDSHPVTALRAIGMLWDRAEGKPTQTINVHDEAAAIDRQELLARLGELKERIASGPSGPITDAEIARAEAADAEFDASHDFGEGEPQDDEGHEKRITLPSTAVVDVTPPPRRGGRGHG